MRYALFHELASGGMASVWLAIQRGDGGFSRVVAVKRPYPEYAQDEELAAMLRDEARLSARIRHPNVVPTLDVAAIDGELLLVMEYVAGESLGKLLASARSRQEPVDPAIAAAVMCGVLEGLHAAHQATNQRGVPLSIVHRDVSPQNILVGVDGAPRVVDFGVAKATERHQLVTQAGQTKGKLLYMSPEQAAAKEVDRRSDLWSASAVLWEMVAGSRLFPEALDAVRYHAGRHEIRPASELGGPAALDGVLAKGLARRPDDRFATARDMLIALERAVAPAPARRVGQWVQKLARDALRLRATYIEELEAEATITTALAPPLTPGPPAYAPPRPRPAPPLDRGR